MNPETNVYRDLSAMYGDDFSDMLRQTVENYTVTNTVTEDGGYIVARTITEGGGGSGRPAPNSRRDRDPFDEHEFDEESYNEDQLKRLGVK